MTSDRDAYIRKREKHNRSKERTEKIKLRWKHEDAERNKKRKFPRKMR